MTLQQKCPGVIMSHDWRQCSVLSYHQNQQSNSGNSLTVVTHNGDSLTVVTHNGDSLTVVTHNVDSLNSGDSQW